ncbi:DUF2878 domain-containing protein [Pseudoalteromonas sp. H105]|uniref:DUF2878 domain-containing protein n=1 Tax=Pseudoalteromonas sp. H105 TaxID=1348393 RepID=UPI0007324304|nr:hypothetical protein ATS75_04890 [Pseudoalteromonas sp. H105]
MALRSIINFILFQGVWFMALLLENSALLPISCVLFLMLFLSQQKKQDSLLLVCGLFVALVFEFLMVKFGLLGFKSNPFPFWFVLLWSALILTINTSMQFLTRLPWQLSLVVCAVFAPASYWAGARFDVITVMQPLWFFWLIYGVSWAVMFNCILALNTFIKLKIKTKTVLS